MNNGHNRSGMGEQSRRKLGVIGRSSTLSQSFEISSYPKENIVTCAEYPNPFPKRYYSKRYRQGPGACGDIREDSVDFYKSEHLIAENPVSFASDSTPLLRLSSLSSQYNVSAYSHSPPLYSSSAPSDDNMGDSTNSLNHLNLNVYLNGDKRSISRLSPGDAGGACECHRSPGMLSKTNSSDSINLFDPAEMSIENRTLSRCSITDTNKLKSGSTGNLHNSWTFNRNGRPAFDGNFVGSKTISGSLGSRGIVGAAGLGIGIGAGNFSPDSGPFGRDFSGTRTGHTTLCLEEDDETKRSLKLILSSVGWWGIRIFLYTFYVGVLLILLIYTYVATNSTPLVSKFLIVLSVITFVTILFCVCFVVFI